MNENDQTFDKSLNEKIGKLVLANGLNTNSSNFLKGRAAHDQRDEDAKVAYTQVDILKAKAVQK